MVMVGSQSTRRGGEHRRETRLDRAPPLGFALDGTPMRGFAGGSVTAALQAARATSLRRSPRVGARRGAFRMGARQRRSVVVQGHRRPIRHTPVLSGTIA